MRLKRIGLVRSAGDVGKGDFINVTSGGWKRIESITIADTRVGKVKTFHCADGSSYEQWNILRYAKAEDLTE